MLGPLERAIAYTVIGISGEVAFTAIKALIYEKKWDLQGFTQLWVIPLYSLGGIFIFEPLHWWLFDSFILLRLSVYAIGIFLLEYIAGVLVTAFVGHCPWEYTGKGNVTGYIYLPYFPVWCGLGLILELVHNYLVSIG